MRQYHKIDTEFPYKVLLDACWIDVFLVEDINVCAEAFTVIMQHELNSLVSLWNLRVKQHSIPCGYNPAIAAARRHWDMLHRKALKSVDPELWSATGNVATK